MIWTEEKDILMMMREMAAQGIFQYKTGTRERGNLWEVIAKNLNKNRDLFKAVTSRGVRDRFTLILKRHKAKNAEELRATGAGSDDEQEEYEQLLEELAHLSDESDKQADEEAQAAKAKINKDREVALDIRKKAMETMGQTSKRNAYDDLEDDEIKEKKKRRSGADTLSWLDKKAERDLKFKELQLEEQRKERESQQKERQEQMKLMQKQLQIQAESQQQQQQQQMMLMQQIMGLMQQQLQLFAAKKEK